MYYQKRVAKDQSCELDPLRKADRGNSGCGKIRVLREKYNAENTPEAQARLAELEETIGYFDTMEPSNDWEERLNEAKRLLNS